MKNEKGSFLSTTADHDVAVVFAGGGMTPIDEGHVTVIFEILIDTRLPLAVPFARIDSQSKYKDEEEILFSTVAVFHIENVAKTDENFWHIELILDTNKNNEQWLLFTNHLNN